MFTKQEIYNQLKEMNVPQDRPVVVHTSLRAIGETEGRGEGLLDVLTLYVTEKGGLLCVPTHTWHHCADYTEPTLDINSDDVCTGTFSKIAARSALAHRSAHPTHSVAVFGDSDKAEKFIKCDEYVKSSSDPCGCMGELEREDGYILLIGVGQEKNTYIHTAEEALGVNNRITEKYYPTSVKMRDGSIAEHPVRLIDAAGIYDVSVFYPKFEPPFRHYGCITYGKIGNADAQLCSSVKIKEVIKKIIGRSGGKELLADDLPLDKALYM